MGDRPADRSPSTDSRTYGRRQGRPLRAGLRALIDERLPGLTVPLPEVGKQIDLEALFAPIGPEAYWLEIGFGAGEHLAWQAAQNPGVGILGAEVFINGIASLVREIDAQNIENIRIYEGDGRDLLAALPAGALSRVFLLFADPWPKRRHHKRRFIQRESLDRLAALIRPGGELRLATDHMGHLDWMLERTSAHRAFQWLAQSPEDWRRRPADWPESRYERKAIDQGLKPVYLRFRRR
ncbi:MAG: tRNA (guanosine(46)-N7)-methyltransferase TrmB [Pseudomonadota bacterium]